MVIQNHHNHFLYPSSLICQMSLSIPSLLLLFNSFFHFSLPSFFLYFSSLTLPHFLSLSLLATQMKRQGVFRFPSIKVSLWDCSNHVGEPFPHRLFPAQVPAALALVSCLQMTLVPLRWSHPVSRI